MEPKHIDSFFWITNFLKDRKVHFNVMHLREELGIRETDI